MLNRGGIGFQYAASFHALIMHPRASQGAKQGKFAFSWAYILGILRDASADGMINALPSISNAIGRRVVYVIY